MAKRRRIVVVGGGLSGASFALQALRGLGEPLSVDVLEPRVQLGEGLAFSTTDPDHRLNAPAGMHYAFPEGLDDFERWFVETGGLDRDPEAAAPGGGLFPRRHEFAAYVSELLRPYQEANRAGSPLRHLRIRATDVRDARQSIQVMLEGGDRVEADAVILATGTRPAVVRSPFDESLTRCSAFISSPWDPERLRAIDKDARVLILGTALTTFDLIATLVREGHRRPITAISRRGVRPHPRAEPTGVPPPSPWHRIIGPMPPFLTASGEPTLMGLVRALRSRIREVEAAGSTWHGPFDELRDSVWQLWPRIRVVEKRRFMRHLRTWYDAHRFRSPPQTQSIVANAEARGLARFCAARALAAEVAAGGLRVTIRDRGTDRLRTETFDIVINCTGIEAGPGNDALSRTLERAGTVRPHPSGFGWDVDEECRAIRRDGLSQQRLFVIGAPSAGVFGDPIGSPFIVAQIWRIMPSVGKALAGSAGL